MNRNRYIRKLEEVLIAKNLIIEELTKENETLKKRLHIYENPHTPPSAKRFPTKKKLDVKPKEKKKRGAPKGHRGATRPTPIPTDFIEVVAKTCELCQSKNLEDLDETEKRIREDIPPPQVIKTIEYHHHTMECLDCGYKFVSKHPDSPKVGNFGIYLLVYVTMLKYHLRGVLRRIQDYLLYSNNFDISTKGVLDILLRVGDVCKVEYVRTIERIRKSNWVHVDETGFHINGEHWWLWIFRSSNNDVLVVIRKSRGSDVVKEILGPDWNKPVIVDGWSAYTWLRIIQRCWSHLIREVDTFIEVSKEGKQLSEDVHARFKTLKEMLDKDLSRDERLSLKKKFDKDMEDLVKKYDSFKELSTPVTYIRNGLGKWNTCLLFPGMAPTNNLGEQAIREHVIIRKIIGCFRSKSGAENYQYIASLLASWKLQGKNIFEELAALLRHELCLS